MVSSPEFEEKTVVGNSPPPKTEPAPRVTKTPEQLKAEAAELAARRAAEEAACKQDLQCWGDRHTASAGIYCDNYVERLAKYSFEWTDGWLESKFSHFRWKDKDRGYMTFIGDKIRFQNGFGAWQNYIYECDLDTEHDRVIDVRARPGRL